MRALIVSLLSMLFLSGALLAQEAAPTPPATKEAPAPATPNTPAAGTPDVAGDQGPLPEVLYDPSLLPEPVRKMRERILEAAISGDPEKLRPVVESNELPPAFSFAEQGDPIAALKEESNDGAGGEILAILAEVMEAGFVHADAGTPQEMWVWPYFAQYPLTRLTPPQKVELFRIVTSFEFKEMQEFGAYNFYRVGIGPDGTWHFFVAGD